MKKWIWLIWLSGWVGAGTVVAAEDKREHPSAYGFAGLAESYQTYGRSTLNLWRESGARWIRGVGSWDVVQWSQRELLEQRFNWNYLDAIVGDMERMGIKMVGGLWFNRVIDTSRTDGWYQECLAMPELDKKVYSTDLGREASFWEIYVYNVVRHYRDKIGYWEVWNEEDTAVFKVSCTNNNPSPTAFEDYARLLRVTFGVMKQADPTAKLVIGGLSDWDPAAGADNSPGRIREKTKRFLRVMKDNGAWGSFDVLAMHPYVSVPVDRNPNSIAEYTTDLVRYLRELDSEYNKEIWYDEIGGAVCGTTGSVEEQGRVMERLYSQALSHSSGMVKKVFWYKLNPNSKTSTNPEDVCYNISDCVDGSSAEACSKWRKRPAFEQFKRMAWGEFNKGDEIALNREIDLISRAKDFYWENGDGQREWGVTTDPEKGIVRYLDWDEEMEDGSIARRGSYFYSHPQWKNDGLIKATMDFDLPNSEKIVLTGKLGFPRNVPATNGVRVSVVTRDPSDPTSFPVIWQRVVLKDGRMDEMEVNLTPYRGLKQSLILVVETNGDFGGDGVEWVDLKIRHNERSDEASSFLDDFEQEKSWTLAEEIVGGSVCYGSGLARIGSSSEVAYQGNRSFKVEANKTLSLKSNHVIAVKKLSANGQKGKYKYEIQAHIDPATARTGQAGPEFSVQNTRKIDSQFLTTTGGIQYRINPWDNPKDIWAIWVKKAGGGAEWVSLMQQPLEAGKWYDVSFSVNFDTNKYDRFWLRGNGIDIERDISSYEIGKEAKWDEEAFDITLESENLWNNCGASGVTNFNVYYDNVNLEYLGPGTEVKGDANGDGRVDLLDFTIWKREFLGEAGSKSDFNRDSRIDLADFMIWKRGFTGG